MKLISSSHTNLKNPLLILSQTLHISDSSAVARIVVTNGQRLFKFENISIGNDGHFSVKYLFPDDGTHQVITRLDTNNSVNLALFNVFVPHQSPPGILVPFPSSPSSSTTGSNNIQQISLTAIIVGLVSSVAVATIFIIRRK
jgi:hypothetical protein